MKNQEFLLNTATGASVRGVQEQIQALWEELQNPQSAAYRDVADFLKNEGVRENPSEVFASDSGRDVDVVPTEENFDPVTVATVVVTWIGLRVADKAFDFLWERYVVPRAQRLWGADSITPK